MRWKPPFFGHVLAWFFFNLAVLAVVAVLVIRFQWRSGLDSLLTAQATPRLTSMANVVAGELRATSPRNWPDVLGRLGGSFKVELMLCRPDGSPLRGESVRWPEQVARRLAASVPPGNRPPPGDGPGAPPPGPHGGPEGHGPNEGPPPRRPGNFSDGPPRPVVLPDGSPALSAEPGTRGPPPGGGQQANAGPPVPPNQAMLAFWLREADGSHWGALRINAQPRDGDRALPGGGQVVLLVRATDLAAAGLAFDPKPWLWMVAAAALLSAIIWWPFVRTVNRRLRAMDAATARLAAGDFEVSLAPGNVLELADLARSIEAMGAKLQAFVTGQRRFLGDIAHELCSPIARMEMALGILESRVADAGRETTEPISDLRTDVREMANLVNELLSFSKASLAAQRIDLSPVELLPLVEETISREDLQDVSVEIAPGLVVPAQPDLLRRALANLLRNARRHGGPGPITVNADSVGENVVLRVIDEGPGVAPEDLPRLFEPFYRPDLSRTRATGGAGLGLAIVQSCVKSCGGTVTLENRQPHGLEARIAFPAVITSRQTADS